MHWIFLFPIFPHSRFLDTQEARVLPVRRVRSELLRIPLNLLHGLVRFNLRVGTKVKVVRL